jgi:small subunit ribosomal protein S16
VTAIDRQKARGSKVLEELGSFDPLCLQEDRQVVLNRERIEYWLSVGAQPSAVVKSLLKRQGITTAAS